MSKETIKELEEKVKELEDKIKSCETEKAVANKERFLIEFDIYYAKRHSKFDIALIPLDIKEILYKKYQTAIILHEVNSLQEWFKRNYYLFAFGFFYEDKDRYIPIYENELDLGKMKIVYALYIEKVYFYLPLKNVNFNDRETD